MENGLEFEFIDVTQSPPSREELQQMVLQAGLPLKKFFNTSGLQYRALNMKQKLASASDEDMLGYLSNEGRLVKRPILTDGQLTTIGGKQVDLDVWSRQNK